MIMASGEFLWRHRMNVRAEVPWEMEMLGDVIQKQIFYYPKTNSYSDEYGEDIFDIFEFLTPNDIKLFKDRPYGNVFFIHREDPSILIEMRHIGPSLEYNPELQREFKLLEAER